MMHQGLHRLLLQRNLLKENLNVAYEFIKDRLTPGEADELEQVKAGEAKVMEVDGKKCGAYRDEQGTLHVVSAVCTHLGCINHWNEEQKSWDCPCHGSRFDINGEVLEGPAIAALQKMK